jgi:hypothetical protein
VSDDYYDASQVTSNASALRKISLPDAYTLVFHRSPHWHFDDALSAFDTMLFRRFGAQCLEARLMNITSALAPRRAAFDD